MIPGSSLSTVAAVDFQQAQEAVEAVDFQEARETIEILESLVGGQIFITKTWPPPPSIRVM